MDTCGRDCVIDKQLRPQVIDVDLPWQDRPKEMLEIQEAALQNMFSHSQSKGTKQLYQFILVCGASGVGKSRLCWEACKNIMSSFPELKLEEDRGNKCGGFSSVHYLFTDFSLAGGISHHEKLKGVQPSVILGLRLASSFFLQSHANKILDALAILGQESDIHLFTLDNVAALIARDLTKPIALLWHLDEFHHMQPAIVRDLVAQLGTFMTQQTQPFISITPLFSGTASIDIRKSLKISKLHDKTIFLQILTRVQSEAIVNEVLKDYPMVILHTELCRQPLHQLGDWPRFLDLFCTEFKRSINVCGPDAQAYFALVLRRTRDAIKHTYKVDSWNALLGGDHETFLHNMCLYALTKRRVTLDEKLNGLTVAKVRDTGILMLTSAGMEAGKGVFYCSLCTGSSLERVC